jgi:hypothetical protein
MFTDAKKAIKKAKSLAEKDDYQSANVIYKDFKYYVYAPANNHEALTHTEVKIFYKEG